VTSIVSKADAGPSVDRSLPPDRDLSPDCGFPVENTPVPQLGVLISGRGSNLVAIADAIAAGRLRASIAVVISNRSDAKGLEFARARGITAMVMPHSEFHSRDAYDRALVQTLRSHGVTLVCLAGFMRRLGESFCDAFPMAVLNIHPSLLPAFPGVDAQRQALDHGVRITGATVHFVTPELDAGPIVMQAAVPVEDADTADTLAARILVEEHRIYPAAIRRVLEDDWRIDGRRAVFSSGPRQV
jgi:phosphoribosylglycinamide formyltransferase-1